MILSVRQLHKQSPSLRALTVSAGVAIFPAHGSSGKDLIQATDAALYQAKEEGRDRVVVAHSDKGHAFSQLKTVGSIQ